MTAATRPLIIVTGASSGLGLGFAERFAARGCDLVLIARREARLRELADRLLAEHGATSTVIAADLAYPQSPGRIVAELKGAGQRVDGLVNCAGFGTAGPFSGEDPARIAAELAVNVTAPTILTQLLMPQLLESPAGVLVMVSSTAGHQPVPNMAVYAASKTYLTSLSAALWQEARGSELRVLSVCPGPTATEFFEASGSEIFKVGKVVPASDVLDVAFAALDRRSGGPIVTVGRLNRIRSFASRHAPLRLTLAVGAKATQS